MSQNNKNMMDDLLSAFDPLHSGAPSSSSSLSSSATSSGAQLPSNSNASNTKPSFQSVSGVQSPQQQQQQHHQYQTAHTPVSLSQTPLDLLLFDNDSANTASTSSIIDDNNNNAPDGGGRQSHEPSKRPQSHLLQELQDAEQNFDTGASNIAMSSDADNQHRPRRPSLGFSPPRRMSRSGLMHDESYYNQQHGHSHNHSRESSSSLQHHHNHSHQQQHNEHRRQYSGSQQYHTEFPPHASPPTMISEEPSDLFHPSSPPAGATIESLRQKGYFGSGLSNTIDTPSSASAGSSTRPQYASSGLPPPHPTANIAIPGTSTNPTQALPPSRQRRTSTSDREAFQGLNSGSVANGGSGSSASASTAQNHTQPKSRSSFIANALRAPPPPFSSPSLKQSFQGGDSRIGNNNGSISNRPALLPPPPSSTSSSSTAPLDIQPRTYNNGTITESAPPTAKPKPTKKHTFEFPTFGSLGHSSGTNANPCASNSLNASKSYNDTTSMPHRSAPNSRIGSPSSSMIIDSEPLPPIILKVPAIAESSKRVLTDDIADGIRPSLPSRIKLCKTWSLLYSLDAHGTSLTTLYDRVNAGIKKAAGGCVLVVKDMEGGIFGAYVNEAFKKSELYYGNGECFLWRVDAFPSNDNFRVGPIVKSYRWTARNDYLILSDSGFLSVGGGDGKFGLWIDSSFDKGFTTSCPAFANEPLCSPSLVKTGVDGQQEGKFDVMAVECWAVG